MAASCSNRYFCHSFHASQTQRPSAITVMAMIPCLLMDSRAVFNSARSSHPVTIAAPAQIAAPRPAAAMKLGSDMRREPAIGGATVEKPGMNLAITNDHTPHRTKRASVSETQEPGLMDSLHKPDRTR